jgi:chromosome segregation ATPase
LLAESYEKAAADLEQAQARVAEFELSAQQQTDKAGKALKAAEHWKSKCEQFEQNLRAANEKLQALKEQEGLAEKLVGLNSPINLINIYNRLACDGNRGNGFTRTPSGLGNTKQISC